MAKTPQPTVSAPPGVDIKTNAWTCFAAESELFRVQRKGGTFHVFCLDVKNGKEEAIKGLGVDDLAELYAIIGTVLQEAQRTMKPGDMKGIDDGQPARPAATDS